MKFCTGFQSALDRGVQVRKMKIQDVDLVPSHAAEGLFQLHGNRIRIKPSCNPGIDLGCKTQRFASDPGKNGSKNPLGFPFIIYIGRV